MLDPQKSASAGVPSRSTLIFSLLYSMVPLLGFWLIEKYWGLEAGVVAAIVLALAEVAWVYAKERRWEPFACWSALLVLLMGILSWQLQSTLVLRLKPAVFEGIFVLLFLISSAIKKPFMLLAARKQMKDMVFNSFQMEYFSGVNLRLGFFFLMHTVLVVYAALYLSMDAWAFVTGILFYILLGVYFLAEFLYSRFSLRRYVRKMEHEAAFLEYQRNLIQQVRKGKPGNRKDDL